MINPPFGSDIMITFEPHAFSSHSHQLENRNFEPSCSGIRSDMMIPSESK